jgi:hypothetical protein
MGEELGVADRCGTLSVSEHAREITQRDIAHKDNERYFVDGYFEGLIFIESPS